MINTVFTKSYNAPEICRKEVLRYAGCRQADSDIVALMESCIGECGGRLTYRVCYTVLNVVTEDDVCDFGLFKAKSEKLAVNLGGCERVILFGATVGVELDRLISKYSRLSPSKALMLQAFGTERIEALCDLFCEDMEKEYGVTFKPRFSPGYGDMGLEVQKDIFSVLGCSKLIGLSLTDSMLMSPSKSVTAFCGFGQGINKTVINKCANCEKTDCTFRGLK